MDSDHAKTLIEPYGRRHSLGMKATGLTCTVLEYSSAMDSEYVHTSPVEYSTRYQVGTWYDIPGSLPTATCMNTL